MNLTDAALELGSGLPERLLSLGVDPGSPFASGATPWQVWVRLHDRFGRRVTLIDLYLLTAAHQGVEVSELSGEERARLTSSVLSVQYPGMRTTAGTHRSDPIELAGYDPAWPAAFDRWQERLATALAGTTARIEHVGSTAVPGLDAKPVIDVQVSVPDAAVEADYVGAVESNGVELRAREPGHRYFRPAPGKPRTAQVHVCDRGGQWEADHLVLRDYLRAHPDARDAYGALKRRLAGRWRDDRIAYNEAKTEFILATLDRAWRWAETTGWTVDTAG